MGLYQALAQVCAEAEKGWICHQPVPYGGNVLDTGCSHCFPDALKWLRQLWGWWRQAEMTHRDLSVVTQLLHCYHPKDTKNALCAEPRQCRQYCQSALTTPKADSLQEG